MKIGQHELDRLGWFGAKRALAKVLALPAVNPVVQFAARNLLPAQIAHRLPLGRHHVTYRLADGQAVHLLDPLRDIVARDIHWGRSQPTSLSEQRKMRCIELLSKGAATFLDIGAYSGICALVAARSNSQLRAVCFEIVPENFFLLVRNILTNDLAVMVEARLRGIGAEAGTVRLPASIGLPTNPTSMSLGSSFDEGVTVRIANLDAEIGGLAGPFLVKIDVEGYEQHVFEGGMLFITEHRPDFICEILPHATSAAQAIEAMLEPLGYLWFAFEEGGVVPRQHLAAESVPRDWLLSARRDIERIVTRL